MMSTKGRGPRDFHKSRLPDSGGRSRKRLPSKVRSRMTDSKKFKASKVYGGGIRGKGSGVASGSNCTF